MAATHFTFTGPVKPLPTLLEVLERMRNGQPIHGTAQEVSTLKPPPTWLEIAYDHIRNSHRLARKLHKAQARIKELECQLKRAKRRPS